MYKQYFYKKLIFNSLWGSGSFVFITIISFIFLPYIVSKLTIEGYGIYILITSLIGYYGILDFGLGSALIKYVAECESKNEVKLMYEYINSALTIHVIIGLISSVVIIFFANTIIKILNVNPDVRSTAITALIVAALGFFFTFLAAAYKSILQGLHLFKSTSIIDSITTLFLNVFLVITLYLEFGLIGAIIVNVFIAFVTFVLFTIQVKKRLVGYKIRFAWKIQIIKQIFKFSIYVFLSKLSNIFANYIVRFVISFFIGPSAVTYYVVPSKLVGALGGIASSAISVIFPYSSQLNIGKDSVEIKKVYLQGSKIFIGTLVPVVLFLFLFSKHIMTIWMGKDFADNSWIVLSIISFASFIGSFSAIPNLLILGQGNSRLLGAFSLITIVLYCICMPILTKLYAITGTAISLLIVSVGVIYYVILKTSQFCEIKLADYFSSVIKSHIPIILAAICVLIISSKFDLSNSYLVLIVGLFLMAIYYLLLFKYNVIPIKKIIKEMRNKI